MGSDTLLIDLDDAGRRQLCEQLSEREARSVECGQGTTVEIRAGDAEACIADFDNLSDRCTASVGDADVCLQAIEEEPCVVFVGDGGPCEALSRCPLSM